MYKVMIIQIMKNKIIGKIVLIEDFNSIREAICAAEEHSRIYDSQVYQIREYDITKKFNIISFSESDTGKIVYESEKEEIIK